LQARSFIHKNTDCSAGNRRNPVRRSDTKGEDTS
jgi:hypothetical protein